MFIAHLNSGAFTPEEIVGFLSIIVLSSLAIYIFVRWLLNGPVQPDPWDKTVEAEMEKEEAPALCYHCLAPHDDAAEFCPECGAAVGPYTNFTPFLYIFSMGQALRIGTSGNFRRSPVTIIGFILFSLAEYTIFAPAYWFVMLRNLSRRQTTGSGGDPAQTQAAAG